MLVAGSAVEVVPHALCTVADAAREVVAAHPRGVELCTWPLHEDPVADRELAGRLQRRGGDDGAADEVGDGEEVV